MKHPNRWPSLRFSLAPNLPAKPGLYAVMSLGRILYIGRSSNIQRRWTSRGDWRHHRYWLASLIPWCRIAYYSTPHHKALERKFIEAHRPSWNDTCKPWWGDSNRAWLGKLGAIGWLLWAKRKPRKAGWLATVVWWGFMVFVSVLIMEFARSLVHRI